MIYIGPGALISQKTCLKYCLLIRRNPESPTSGRGISWVHVSTVLCKLVDNDSCKLDAKGQLSAVKVLVWVKGHIHMVHFSDLRREVNIDRCCIDNWISGSVAVPIVKVITLVFKGWGVRFDS